MGGEEDERVWANRDPSAPIAEVKRTPDACFEDLPDYPFEPHFTFTEKRYGQRLRIHYVAEGPVDSKEVILCLHGEPTWSFLYRHMVPVFVEAGFRVVVPDLIGFGKSDKPTKQSDYTYERHVEWMGDFIRSLSLRNITLVCQDWGGLIGLRLVAAFPRLFARVVAANTGLPSGSGSNAAFRQWLEVRKGVSKWSTIVDRTGIKKLTDAEKRAYDAPFPDESYKAGSREFPALVPVTPSHPSVQQNKEAWQVLSNFHKPFLTAWGNKDPVFPYPKSMELLRGPIPGARNQHHTSFLASHFCQEDNGPVLARIVVDFVKANPLAAAKL